MRFSPVLCGSLAVDRLDEEMFSLLYSHSTSNIHNAKVRIDSPKLLYVEYRCLLAMINLKHIKLKERGFCLGSSSHLV